MSEAPWPDVPRDCHVELWPSKLVAGVLDGWLTYRAPDNPDRNDCIPITTGPSRDDLLKSQDGTETTLIRWHWHDNGDGTGFTEPSIHYRGVYHSPYRTRWIKTPANPDGTWPVKA